MKSPDDARWHLRASDLFTLLCETHSSGAIRREQSLFTAPVRLLVVMSVVGDLEPTTPVGLDRPDLTLGSGVIDKGYPLTGRRVGRVLVVRGVIGDWLPASPIDLDCVDLIVVSVVARICYLLTAWRVGRLLIGRGVVGEGFLAPSARICKGLHSYYA
jgi:hypothetical protein